MSLPYDSSAYDPNIAGMFAQSERGGNLTSEYPSQQRQGGGGSAVPYAALIGAAMQMVQGNQQRKAQAFAEVQSEDMKKKMLAHLQKTKGIESLFSGLQEAQLKTGHQKELGGFKGAKTALDLGAIQAQQGVQARGKQNQAALEQNIVSRGLLGTSTGTQALGNLQDRTSLQLSAIDQQHAQALSELGLQQSSVEGMQQRELAGLLGQRKQFLTDLSMQEAALQPGKKKKKASKFGQLAEGFISGGASELFGSQVYGPEYDTGLT